MTEKLHLAKTKTKTMMSSADADNENENESQQNSSSCLSLSYNWPGDFDSNVCDFINYLVKNHSTRGPLYVKVAMDLMHHQSWESIIVCCSSSGGDDAAGAGWFSLHHRRRDDPADHRRELYTKMDKFLHNFRDARMDLKE